MIDLHLHLLPGVDDGARDLAEAVEMCRIAREDGCTTLVATPHRRRDEWPDRPVAELERDLARLAEAAGERPALRLGGEVRVDSDLPRDLAREDRGGAIPLAGSRYLLCELEPSGFGPDPVEMVRQLVRAGWRPIVAHPEVTPALGVDGVIEALAAAGALFQVTGASVVGDYGRPVRERVLEMIGAGHAHFLASDAHRPDWRPTGLSRARSEVERLFGTGRAEALTAGNPAAVLADRPLPAVAAGAGA